MVVSSQTLMNLTEAELSRAIQGKPFHRSLEISEEDYRAADTDDKLIALTFSSETAVNRWWGTEILVHGSKNVRMGRLQNNAPFLMNHDTRDLVGVVAEAKLTGKQGRAKVKFSQAARPQEIRQDVKDGIRTKISVGYYIHKWEKEEVQDDQGNVQRTYRITDWEPYEISLVSVPADDSVGIGRDLFNENNPFRDNNTPASDVRTTQPGSTTEAKQMVVNDTNTQNLEGQRGAESNTAPPVEPTENRQAATVGPDTRLSIMMELGRAFGAADDAQSYYLNGKSVEEFRAYLKDRHQQKQAKTETPPMLRETDNPNHLDLSKKDKKRYRLGRAIVAAAEGTMEKDAGFELECSRELMKRLDHEPEGKGFLVPYDYQMRELDPAFYAETQRQIDEAFRRRQMQRDMNVASFTQGGALVGTDYMAGSFLDLLRTNIVVTRLGATYLTGLVGDISVPRQTGSGTAYWIDEGQAVTESDQSFAQMSMSPKTLGAVTEMTRKLLLQSDPSIEALVQADLIAVLARAIDKAAINGSGMNGEPLGIIGTSGVEIIDASSFNWVKAVSFETAVLEDDAGGLGSPVWVARPSVAGTLKTREKGSAGYPVYLLENGTLNGYPFPVTTQMPAATLLFGMFNNLIIGEWGTLEIRPNPYGSGFRAGNYEIMVIQSLDINVRYPQAFKVGVSFS